jgi:predicted transcriptional regulator
MNQTKVKQRQMIVSLHEQDWTKRKIARELALDRATVRKYLAGCTAKSPTPHTGCAVVPGLASVCAPWGADRGGR